MKNIKTIAMACIVIGTGITTSCKKYDEGGTEWRTKAKITDKTWEFDYASDTDTNFRIMDSWKTMQFEKNGDWVVNGNKWGTHNFTKDHENEKKHNLYVYVDSSSLYYDSIAILGQTFFNTSAIPDKETTPVLSLVFNITLLKSKSLGLKPSSNNLTHKTYYNAE